MALECREYLETIRLPTEEDCLDNDEGPKGVFHGQGRTGRKLHQYKWHWNVESTQYQTTALECREYPSIKWHRICLEYEICYQWHLDVESMHLERTVA